MIKTSSAVQPSEQGQAIVLIVLAIFALFGFAALAIDIGQIFMVRRASQNAADSAALAAAFEAAGGSLDRDTAIAKAFEMASLNGYDNDGVTNWVVVNNPPETGPYCGTCGSSEAEEYYQVKIRVRMEPIFAQFVYGGGERSEVEATSHANGIGAIAAGDTLLSLSDDDDSFIFNGNVTTIVNGGNVRSNGAMNKTGSSGNITVTNGHIYYATTMSGHTGNPFKAAKPEWNKANVISNFPAPYCPSDTELADGTWADVMGGKKGTTLLYHEKEISGVDYYYYPTGLVVENLPPGVHCIQGGIDKGNYVGKGVLIVLLSGGIKQTGGDSINFKAPLDLIDANGNQFGGMMLYAPTLNTSELVMGGNAQSYLQGTVFAPGAMCDIGGTADGMAHHTSVICNKIRFHGNPSLVISYKEEELFRLPPLVELVQ